MVSQTAFMWYWTRIYSLDFSTLAGHAVVSLLNRIPHGEPTNLLSKLRCRKWSASTVNKTERGSGVTRPEEKKKKNLGATPQVPGLVRASSRNVTKMNGSVSPASHMACAFFYSPLGCTYDTELPLSGDGNDIFRPSPKKKMLCHVWGRSLQCVWCVRHSPVYNAFE